MKTLIKRTARAKVTFITRLVASFFLLASLSATAQGAASTFSPDGYRLVTAARKFDDTSQLAIVFRLQAPKKLRAHRFETAIGTISSDTGSEAFVSVGPVWRFPLRGTSMFIDFGFSPTLLSGSRFNGRELGGQFHFTSSLAFGTRFGSLYQYSLSIRAQHTSNGGIDGTNPGLDMLGLTFAVEFRD